MRYGIEREHHRWLTSYHLTCEDDLFRVSIKADGLERDNYNLVVDGNELKIGMIRKQNGSVAGIVNENFPLPYTSKAKLLSHEVVGDTLQIVIKRIQSSQPAQMIPALATGRNEEYSTTSDSAMALRSG